MIKAVGYDHDGNEVVVVREPTVVLHHRPGWAEQDMTAVWQSVASAVSQVASQLDGPIDFIATTAQGDGVWLIDKDGNPTASAILWSDARGASVLDGWMQSGVLDKAFPINGSLSFAGSSNAILSWMNENQPSLLARSHRALTCGGWIFHQMTGIAAADMSDAAVPFMDIRTSNYSKDLLNLYDLDHLSRLLPTVLDESNRVGFLRTNQLGVPVGTPVVMAPYDIVCAAIGSGVVHPGQACTILGTTICTEMVTDGIDLDDKPVGLTIPLGHDNLFLRSFPTQSGGEILSWACRLLGLADPGQLSDLAAGSPPGAGGLTFLPYLSPAGERAPFLDPLVRGALLGLTTSHTRSDIARAVFEGLCFSVRDCLAASQSVITELRLCGGGAASDFWAQLIADVVDQPVSRSADNEIGARGAYLVGLTSTGRGSLDEAVERHVRTLDTFSPHPERSHLYAKMSLDFCAAQTLARTFGSRP